MHVRFRFPQHVDQLQVALLVHRNVGGHLRIESVDGSHRNQINKQPSYTSILQQSHLKYGTPIILHHALARSTTRPSDAVA